MPLGYHSVTMDSHILLTVRPSRHVAAAVAVVYLLACGAVVDAGLPWPWRAALLLAIVASSSAVLGSGRASGVLRCQGKGGVAQWQGEDWVTVEVLPETVVLPWLVVLRYRVVGRRRATTLVIARGELAADDFRRLKVWLRWRPGSKSG